MKTAVSIPQQTFEAAEQLAGRMGMSRSELYSKAISTYILIHRDDHVTDILNRIYADERSSLDAMTLKLQSLSLPEDAW